MKDFQLDEEEQEILDAFETGKLQSDLTSERKEFIERSAQHAFKKYEGINISGRNLAAIRRKALVR